MRIEQIKEIADAVLYEGYLLYPYRQSALKNRTRWTFGVVYPREYSEANGGIEPWTMHTECLVEGVKGQVDDISLDITVRFLHLLARTVVQPETVKDEHVEADAGEWSLASRFADEPLQEGVEREVSVLDLPLSELIGHPELRRSIFPANVWWMIRTRYRQDKLSGNSNQSWERSCLARSRLVKIFSSSVFTLKTG